MESLSAKDIIKKLCILTVIVLLFGTQCHSKPVDQGKKYLKFTDLAYQSCKNHCFGDYELCAGAVSSELGHKVCLTSRILCLGGCSVRTNM